MQQLEDADVIAALYWKIGYKQDIGARKEQQDNYGVVLGVFQEKPALLAVLADGMGGMRNGAEFSRIAVDYHREHFQNALDTKTNPPDILLSLALGANKEANKIYDEDHPGGTTLISAFFFEDRFYTLSVGDSRIYIFRENALRDRYLPLQLNREHILGASLDERAWMGQISFEDAEDNMYRESLISGIGDVKIRRVDLPDYSTRFIGGDKLVLVSDGIYRSLSDMEMAEYMKLSPDAASDAIVNRILEKNMPHQDNMSIVIIERI